MQTIKPNENGEVTLYGITTKINGNAKTVRLYGVEYKVDWGGKSSKKTTEPKVSKEEKQDAGQPSEDNTEQPSEV